MVYCWSPLMTSSHSVIILCDTYHKSFLMQFRVVPLALFCYTENWLPNPINTSCLLQPSIPYLFLTIMAARRVKLGTRFDPKGESVTLGRAIEPTPQNRSWIQCVLCCPFQVTAWIYIHIFQSNPAACFFYLGIMGTGGGYGVTTYVFSYEIDSILCFISLTKMVGR